MNIVVKLIIEHYLKYYSSAIYADRVKKQSACLQSWHILSSTTLMNITMIPKELDGMALMSKKSEKHTTNLWFYIDKIKPCKWAK